MGLKKLLLALGLILFSQNAPQASHCQTDHDCLVLPNIPMVCCRGECCPPHTKSCNDSGCCPGKTWCGEGCCPNNRCCPNKCCPQGEECRTNVLTNEKECCPLNRQVEKDLCCQVGKTSGYDSSKRMKVCCTPEEFHDGTCSH